MPLAARLPYIAYRYTISRVIRSFRDKDTQALFAGRCPRRWIAIRRVAERKLAQLDAAATLEFLRAPPGNRLEALKGDRAGQWSIRVNDRWRICFQWSGGDALDVEIVDYH
jgi:proteic killer suppression protein